MQTPHQHIYDGQGNIICCSLEEKIDANTSPRFDVAERKRVGNQNLDSHTDCGDKHVSESTINQEEHSDDDGHNHGSTEMTLRSYLPAMLSFVLLISGLVIGKWIAPEFMSGWVKALWFTVAYIPVGLPVFKEAWEALLKGEVFTEFFLMSIATIGAFAIGEYPEGVAVMLFYAIGELFQTAAVQRAKSNIKALLDVRPNIANVARNGSFLSIDPSELQIGEIIQVKVGEKIPLDGVLLSEKASLNTAALTGESKPQSVLKDENALAGSINLESVIELKVTKLFNDSSIARILEMVQNATSRKAKTELLIRRLAKIYTPIVVYLAIAICILPYFFVDSYVFKDWLYRALIFLVISCPCALVISIPLGYFGGLGAASRHGLLFKGATYLDKLTEVNTLVMDKTGTVTEGVFKIQKIQTTTYAKNEFMRLLMALEAKSTHPIAKAIMGYNDNASLPEATEVEEIAGKGLRGIVEGQQLLVGNKKLMQQFSVSVPSETDDIVESIVMVAINGDFAGYVTIADELKSDAHESIRRLRAAGIKSLTMLSGDKDSITQKVANELGIDYAHGGLLPEDKLAHVENLKQDKTKLVAFVGDGINDAPVLAASDVGIAMGAMGSDVAIETADIIIQNDEPSRIATGIEIGRATQKVIWQNITLAFVVKALVLIAGAFGLATMWQAVFSDVGVALLAIMNAVRLQKMELK